MQKYVLMTPAFFLSMIGVFDSGFGGLTVLKEFLKELPEYDYLYLGDNARTPYGNRSTETLMEFGEQAMDYLFGQGCTLIIIACNTMSSNVLRHLQEKYLRAPKRADRKILGVIKPLAEEAARVSKNGRIGVVGTRSTIHAKSYEAELQHINPALKIFGEACPLLVPLIEENWYHKPETRMILKKYLLPLKSHNIDTLILGCTHYHVLEKEIRHIMGRNVRVLESGKIIAASLKDYLMRHPEIEKPLSAREVAASKKKRWYRTTDDAQKFAQTGTSFLQEKINDIQKIHF